jgi:hypothetical protein
LSCRLPEAEHLQPGSTQKILSMPEHAWIKGLSPEQRQRIKEYYEKRYQQ